jgi:plasmid stabilization system protein ParE
MNLRSFGVKGSGNYVIFYSRITGGIEVFHVLHGARDIEALLGEGEP